MCVFEDCMAVHSIVYTCQQRMWLKKLNPLIWRGVYILLYINTMDLRMSTSTLSKEGTASICAPNLCYHLHTVGMLWAITPDGNECEFTTGVGLREDQENGSCHRCWRDLLKRWSCSWFNPSAVGQHAHYGQHPADITVTHCTSPLNTVHVPYPSPFLTCLSSQLKNMASQSDFNQALAEQLQDTQDTHHHHQWTHGWSGSLWQYMREEGVTVNDSPTVYSYSLN